MHSLDTASDSIWQQLVGWIISVVITSQRPIQQGFNGVFPSTGDEFSIVYEKCN